MGRAANACLACFRLLRHLISPVWLEGMSEQPMMSIPGVQLRDALLQLLCKLPAAEICKVGHEYDGASCLWSRLQCRGRTLVQVPYMLNAWGQYALEPGSSSLQLWLGFL